MGGTEKNIVQGGSESSPDGRPVPSPKNQYSKGQGKLPHADQFENVPGADTKGYTNKAGATHKEEGAVQKRSPLIR